MVESRVQIDRFTMTLQAYSCQDPARVRGEDTEDVLVERRDTQGVIPAPRAEAANAGSSDHCRIKGKDPSPRQRGGGAVANRAALAGGTGRQPIFMSVDGKKGAHILVPQLLMNPVADSSRVGVDKQGRQVGMCTFKNW